MNELLGYAYSTNWKSRSAYRYTVESSIYLKPNNFRNGIGTALYTKLLESLKEDLEGFCLEFLYLMTQVFYFMRILDLKK